MTRTPATSHSPDSQKNLISRLLSQLFFFQSLTLALRDILSQKAILKDLKKGENLWTKGEPGEFCVIIVEGLIEITNTTADGEERIIGLFGPGELIGLSAILKRISFPANAVISSKNARVIKLYIRSLDPQLTDEQKHEFQNWLKEMLLVHEQILRDKIMILGAGRLHSKLLELFEHLNSRFGTKELGKDITIPVPITKTQIAKMIEARVETVIRTLNKWEKQGFFISTDKGLTIKNIEKLKSMAEVL